MKFGEKNDNIGLGRGGCKSNTIFLKQGSFTIKLAIPFKYFLESSFYIVQIHNSYLSILTSDNNKTQSKFFKFWKYYFRILIPKTALQMFYSKVLSKFFWGVSK